MPPKGLARITYASHELRGAALKVVTCTTNEGLRKRSTSTARELRLD